MFKSSLIPTIGKPRKRLKMSQNEKMRVQREKKRKEMRKKEREVKKEKKMIKKEENKKKKQTLNIRVNMKKLTIAASKKLEKALINGNFEEAYEIALGIYDKEVFWVSLGSVMVEHIHILSPSLPFLFWKSYKKFWLEKKTQKEEEKLCNMIQLVKIFSESFKQEITIYLKSSEFGVPKKCSYSKLKNLITEFNMNLKKLVNDPTKKKRTVNSLFNRTYSLLSIGCDSLRNKDIDTDGINLFTYTYESERHKTIIHNIFNIVLFHSKQNKKVNKCIISLIKLYKSKLLNQIEKHTLIIWNMLFYFCFTIDFEYPPINYFSKNEMQEFLIKLGFEEVKRKKEEKEMKEMEEEKTRQLSIDPLFEFKVYRALDIEKPNVLDIYKKKEEEFKNRLKDLKLQYMYMFDKFYVKEDQEKIKKREEYLKNKEELNKKKWRMIYNKKLNRFNNFVIEKEK